MDSDSDTTTATPINPDCTVCEGTGEDLAFGGRCSMCWWSPMHRSTSESPMVERFASGNQHSRARVAPVQLPSDKQIALIRKLDPTAEIPTNRKMASVLIDKLLGAKEAPEAGTPTQIDATIRFAKVGDAWMVRVPTSVRVQAGQTVTVTKANGTTTDVVLGAQRDDELWTTAPRPAAAPRVVTLPDVPAGYYAIASKGDNDLLFVKVDRPNDGRWAGYTFVKMIVGGHEPTPIRGAQMTDVLRRITEAGVEQSMALYGQEIGRCGRCGRTLTDDESRAYGIGPECRRRL